MPRQDSLHGAGSERKQRVQIALERDQLAGVVCTLPVNVLMLTGYRPVVGTSAAIAHRDGGLLLVVPEDEEELAQNSWADHVRTYKPAPLDSLSSAGEMIASPLGKALHDLKLHCAELGYEFAAISEASYYSGTHIFQGSMITILRDVVPTAPLRPADKTLSQLRSMKTPFEVNRLREACAVAGEAFAIGREFLAEGQSETQAASHFSSGFSEVGMQRDGVQNASGFAWCMSGPNASKAKAAFAHSSARRLRAREPVLVHANSNVDGYWTDITRTYVLGELELQLRSVYEAVFAARAAALAEIRPGARAADVDRAARDVLASRGFDGKCPHAIGHGVGFGAISPEAHPRVHPKSDETLETGMTFNIEPAIYMEGELGVRHCDMVAVTESGVELLTPFDVTLNELLVNRVESAVRSC